MDKTARINCRIYESEKQRIQYMAQEKGMSISEFVLECVWQSLEDGRQRIMKKKRATVALVSLEQTLQEIINSPQCCIDQENKKKLEEGIRVLWETIH